MSRLTSPDRPRRFFVTLFVAASVAAVAALPGRVHGDDSLPLKGPLPPRNDEPLIAPFLQPSPADASVLGKGRTRWDLGIDIANNLLTDSSGAKAYVTDFEDQRLHAGWSRGIGGGQEIGFSTVLIARNGGILDHFINGYHRIFGFSGGGRDKLPFERVLFLVTDADGRIIANTHESANGLGDSVIEYRRALTRAADDVDPHSVATSFRALVKLPTGNYHELFGSGAADAAAGIAATWRPARRFALHGNLSLVTLGKPKIPNLEIRGTSVQSLVAAEYVFDGRTSLLLQTDDAPAPYVSGLSYPDRPRRSFGFGFWRQLNRENRLYFSGAENDFGPFAKQAPDFTMSLGIRRML